MNVNYNFSHNYEIDFLGELPSKNDIYYYPGATRLYGKDGLIIKVSPKSKIKPWIGIFAFGDVGKNGKNGIYDMPDEEKFCIVSNGAGYIACVNDPLQWEMVKSIPVTDVITIRQKDLIVFAGYTELIAYDKSGIKWITKQLSFDNLWLKEQTGDIINGEYYDIRTETIETFIVNVNTGNHTASCGTI